MGKKETLFTGYTTWGATAGRMNILYKKVTFSVSKQNTTDTITNR
jgi:hypothetical protein